MCRYEINALEKENIIMRELMLNEIEFISGGGGESGTLDRPFRGESEAGRWGNDIAGALHSFGGWLGRSVYDLVHRK